MKVIIIAGSEKDNDHVEQLWGPLSALVGSRGYDWLEVEKHVCSAHKNPRQLLDLLNRFENESRVIFVTVAGRSNALSGMVAANTPHIVLACPPFASTADYAVDIHSTLRMPSDVPVLTVLMPGNCVQAVKRILKTWKEDK